MKGGQRPEKKKNDIAKPGNGENNPAGLETLLCR